MLKEKQIAPDFKLPLFGGGEWQLSKMEASLIVLVFYKFSCPTCQLALPILQTIYEAYGTAFPFMAIAQDDVEKTAGFREQYKITIPTVLDLPPYPVSRKYRLETVPTTLLLNFDKSIRYAGEGFVKQELLNLADVLAEKSRRPQIELSGNAEIPEFKPG